MHVAPLKESRCSCGKYWRAPCKLHVCRREGRVNMAEAGKVQALFMYGFIGALLILMAVMLATTPVPEWMDGSGDEGPTIGGPITHRQEKRMPWTFENGVDGGQEQEGEDDPYDEPDVQGYGSKTLVSSEAGTYGIHGRLLRTLIHCCAWCRHLGLLGVSKGLRMTIQCDCWQ